MTEEKKNNSGRKWFDGKDIEDVITKCKEVWAIGGTDAECASYADVSTASLSRYLTAHPKLKEYRNRLKDRPVLLARKTVIKKIPESYANAMDYLKRKRKKEFGDNLDVTTGGEQITGMVIKKDAN